jgi:uncharacterized protein (TIGR00251 family)
VRIAAPATEGKANAALLRFLAAQLRVPPSHISLERGASSRHKVVRIEGMGAEEAERRLADSVR